MRKILAVVMCVAVLSCVAFAQITMKPPVSSAPIAPEHKAPKAATPAKPDKFGLEPSKVTLKYKGAALDEILQALSDQSGNSRLQIPDNWEAKDVVFDASDMTYWQAFDKLCAQLGLSGVLQTTGQYPNQETALTLVSAKGYESVAAYCGPVVVRLAGVTATKRYLPAPAGTESNALELSLAWFCEDRLHPLSSKVEVTKLTGSDGKDIALASAAEAEEQPGIQGGMQPHVIVQGGIAVNGAVMKFPGVKNPAPSLPTAGTVTAKVAALPKDARCIKCLDGVVKMEFGQGKKELKVEDVFGGKNDSAEAGKDKVTVTMARRNMAWANVQIQLTNDGKDVDLAGLATMAPYGVKLVDPNGDAHEPTNLRAFPIQPPMMAPMQGGGANVQIQVQVQGGAAAGPAAGPAVKAPVMRGGSAIMNFMNLPNVDGEWSLVVTVPETRTVKDFAFRLSDIPLP